MDTQNTQTVYDEKSRPSKDPANETISSVEIAEVRSIEVELHHAFAFRVQLDKAQTTHDEQINLINQLRSDSSGVIAFPEGSDTILGFFWTADQFQRFKSIASQFHGTYGIGASYEESQITSVADGVGEKAVIATCEATNAAARTQKKAELSKRLEELDPSKSKEPVYAYRYYVEDKSLIPEGETEEQKEARITEILRTHDNLVRGKKNTILERFIVDDSSEFFQKQQQFNQGITGSFGRLPPELTKPLDSASERESTLHDVTELSVLSIDINGFSNIVHEKTIEWVNAIALKKSEAEILQLKNEIREYRNTIARFFTTLEQATRVLVLAEGNRESQDTIKLLNAIKAIDWRGDAGGMIVPTQYQDLLQRALELTLKAMPDFDVKATIRSYNNLPVVGGLKRKVHSPQEVDETDEDLVKMMQDEKIEKRKGRSIVARYDSNGGINLILYEKKNEGKMETSIHPVIQSATTRDRK